MAGLKELTLPDVWEAAVQVIAAFDDCLRVGLGRLGPEQTQALAGLARICTGTPLETPVGEAVAALGRNEFLGRHFAALACARGAIQGAQHDALRRRAADALGRTSPDESDPLVAEPIEDAAGPLAVWQESTREWLMELALAGFQQLEPQTLAPFAATLEQLQGVPNATRLAALLTGFRDELLAALPISAQADLPVYRWSDLWSRAMIATLRAPPALAGRRVDGSLTVLGVDLRHHGSFASAVFYGVLETEEETRFVRITQSTYKVDVLGGDELWRCFGTAAAPLLQALSQRKLLKLTGTTLLPSDDLLWDGKAALGGAVAIFDTAARFTPGGDDVPVFPATSAADRHPLQLAEPVWLEGYSIENGDGLRLRFEDDAMLPVAMHRMSGTSELRDEQIAASNAMFGLLRFDGGTWGVQPLSVRAAGKKGKWVEHFTGSSAYESLTKKRKDDTLAQLHERAGRLLRKKA